MIDIYDSEAIVRIYRQLKKKCDVIDKFINNHAYYFGPTCSEYGALDVYNNMLELMDRKNKLINLKVIVDQAINTLDVKDRQVLLIKMNYNISMNELCGVLDMKERTAFRRIEHAFANLAEALNKSKYYNKLDKILKEEMWITNMKEEVIEHRQAFRQNLVSI